MPHRVGTPAGSSRPPHRLSRRSLLLAGVGLAGTTPAAALARLTDSYAAPGPPLYTRCSFGAYADNAPYPDLRPFNDLEALIPARLSRMSWFQGFGSPWLAEQAAAAAASGHDLLIAWQPVADGSPIRFRDLLAGHFDDRLRQFFTGAAQYPHRVILRPFWEMNASAARYSLNHQGHDRQVSDVQEFRDTWRYLVALQRSIGGPQVRWFFCANGEDVGSLRSNWPRIYRSLWARSVARRTAHHQVRARPVGRRRCSCHAASPC